MEDKIIATTVGGGPYQPAIKFEEGIWIHPSTHDNEIAAAVVAEQICGKIYNAIQSTLRDGGFRHRLFD